MNKILKTISQISFFTFFIFDIKTTMIKRFSQRFPQIAMKIMIHLKVIIIFIQV